MNAIIDLDSCGVVELDSRAQHEIAGGGHPITWGALLYAVISEWEEVKRAAVDAWNGVYNPPSLR